MPLDPADLSRLHEALALAEQAIGRSDPNPRVGCVIAAADGRIVGRGSTQVAGGPHATVVALDARAPRGSTRNIASRPLARTDRTLRSLRRSELQR